MILFDLHVCVKGMQHPDKCQNYYWLKANEVCDMVSLSREAFAKEHNPIKGGKHDDGDISYEWKSRGDDGDVDKTRWVKGGFEKNLAVRSFYSCNTCGNEGMNHLLPRRTSKCSAPRKARNSRIRMR